MERKEKLIRVLQIMETTDEKSPLNASQIVNLLDNRYMLGEIDRRTIYKDIAMLQYCGYRIKQCKNKRKGWYMEKHIFDDWEIKIMMDSILQAKCITADEAKNIRERLMKLSSERGRSRFSHQIMPQSRNMATDNNMGQYIELMLEAMYLGKQISFQYTELDNKLKSVLRREGKRYQLSVYTLVWSDNTYYLIGSHNEHPNLTNYRLDRIRNLEMTDEPVVPAKDKVGDNPELVIQDYIKKSVGHFGGEAIKVELEYVPNSINNAILYDFAGEDVKVRIMKAKTDIGREDTDTAVAVDKEGIDKTVTDKAIARFTKMDSVTLIGWLTQYATRFKVISPESLKEEVLKELKNGLNNYQ